MALDWSALIVDVTGDPTLLDELKAFLGITDTLQDAELTSALNKSGPMVETYLDRVIAAREVTEEYAHHFGTVTLHNLPVDTAAPVTVTLNGVDQTDYSIWLNRGKMGHLSRTGVSRDTPLDWRKYDQVDVVYTAGYSPIPSDLAQGIVWTAADMYASDGTGAAPGGASGAVKSMSINDVGSISYDVGGSSGGGSGIWSAPGVISEQSAQIVSRYKRMSA